jgi:hypothetical protein
VIAITRKETFQTIIGFERKMANPFKAHKTLKGFFLQFGSMAALLLGFNYARMRAFVEARRGNYLI